MGGNIGKELKRIGGDVVDGYKKVLDPLDLHDGLKKGWDDTRGATDRKNAEAEAAQAKRDSDLADTYKAGTKVKTIKRGKDAKGGGTRGTRLTRQPLGTGR